MSVSSSSLHIGKTGGGNRDRTDDLLAASRDKAFFRSFPSVSNFSFFSIKPKTCYRSFTQPISFGFVRFRLAWGKIWDKFRERLAVLEFALVLPRVSEFFEPVLG